MTGQPSSRLDELLLERATQGLEAEAARELEELLAALPESEESDRLTYELAATALDLAWSAEERGALPPALARSVQVQAREVLAGKPTIRAVGEAAPRAASGPARRQRGPIWPYLAAAAGLLLAVAAWWPRLAPQAAAPGAVRVADGGQSTDEGSADALRLPWQATEDPAVVAGEVGGEVVWYPQQQRGVMRIRGLAANDPRREQYQLWIFDRERDERYPVDGGVFDVSAPRGEAGLVEISFTARLPVGEPYLFAVTVEPPGGVVVSDRSRIALIAQPAAV